MFVKSLLHRQHLKDLSRAIALQPARRLALGQPHDEPALQGAPACATVVSW